MLVSERIAALRKKHGLSSRELSEKLGVSQSTISRYEKGYIRNIPIEKLNLLCEIFDCTLTELVGNDPIYDTEPGSLLNGGEEIIVKNINEINLIRWFRKLSSDEQIFFINMLNNNSESKKFMILST